MHKIIIMLVLIRLGVVHAQDVLPGNWVDDAGWPACRIQLGNNTFGSVFVLWSNPGGLRAAGLNGLNITKAARIYFGEKSSSLVDCCLRKISYDDIKNTFNKNDDYKPEADRLIVRKLLTTKGSEFTFVSRYIQSLSAEICLLELGERRVPLIIKEIGKEFSEHVIQGICEHKMREGTIIDLTELEKQKQTEILQNFYEQWITKAHNLFKDSFAFRKYKFFLRSRNAREELFELLEDIK